MRPRSTTPAGALKPRALSASIALAIALGGLFCAGCSKEIASLDVPWSLGDPPAPAKPTSSPKPGGAAKPSAPVKSSAPTAAKEIESDCDELPELTEDELRGPPYEISLQKSARPPTEPPPRFTALPDVELTAEASAKLDQIDAAFHKRTGRHIVITSGTRDAARQAKAMYKMIRLGADILALYKNKEAAREIKKAYDENAKKSADAAVQAMYDALRGQIHRGVYISAHLRAGAADVRSRAMTASQKKAFVKSIAEAGGARYLEESRPPHFHLQLD